MASSSTSAPAVAGTAPDSQPLQSGPQEPPNYTPPATEALLKLLVTSVQKEVQAYCGEKLGDMRKESWVNLVAANFTRLQLGRHIVDNAIHNSTAAEEYLALQQRRVYQDAQQQLLTSRQRVLQRQRSAVEEQQEAVTEPV
jgi:hypothetical protein